MMNEVTKYRLLEQFGHVSVLDHGFIELEDLMGDDHEVCRAARISTKREDTKINPDRDAKLIHYLMRHHHDSPFEQCELKCHIKLPIFVMRQLVRHRMASLNEMSGRYTELPEEFYVPKAEHVCKQDGVNKQGSAEPVDDLTARRQIFEMNVAGKAEFKRYRDALSVGVAKETARVNLPLSTYTEIFWKVDLRNLLHFIELRSDQHAQYEIRVYADVLAEIVKAWVPQTWEAFEQYKQKSFTVSYAILQAIAASPEVVQAIQRATGGASSVTDYAAARKEFLSYLGNLAR